MKGLLTMLHPPEALPAGHRLPECHSLSRPQSQHASLSFSAHPANPPEPHTDGHVDDHKCCYESNAVSERNAAVCRGRRDLCISPPIVRRGTGLAWAPVVRCECTTSPRDVDQKAV